MGDTQATTPDGSLGRMMPSKFLRVGTTIFPVMSKLAAECGAR